LEPVAIAKAEGLPALVLKVLTEFDLLNNVISVITDNASVVKSKKGKLREQLPDFSFLLLDLGGSAQIYYLVMGNYPKGDSVDFGIPNNEIFRPARIELATGESGDIPGVPLFSLVNSDKY
jgi:hypothetical protein